MKKIPGIIAAPAVALLSCLALAIAPVPAMAAETHSNCAVFDINGNITSVTPNCSQTLSFRGGDPQASPALNPCTGEAGVLTMSFGQQTFHINVNGAGDVWITGTTNGDITFVPVNPQAASYAGKYTFWFGGAQNNRNGTFGDTFHERLTDAAHDTISVHGVDRVTFTATGVQHTVSGFRFTCG